MKQPPLNHISHKGKKVSIKDHIENKLDMVELINEQIQKCPNCEKENHPFNNQCICQRSEKK